MSYPQHGDDGQWDRWNSDSSHSSYYNQPTHRPYGQGFSIASAVCGLLSMMTCCTVVLSLPLGALGILFALLAHRKGRRMNLSAFTGLTLSVAGFAASVALIVYSFLMLPAYLKDDAMRSRLDAMSERMYGISFTEMMEEYYGYSFEE